MSPQGLRKVDLLRQLQETDSELDGATEELSALEARLGRRDSLDRAMAAAESARAEVRRLETDERDLELELEKLRLKISAGEKKLYGGSVTSPKELGSLAQDVHQLGAQVSRREDKLLELLEALDAARAAAGRASAEAEGTASAWQQEQETLAAQRNRLHERIASLNVRRKALVADADPDSARVYENLRRTKGGLAVATIRQRTCQGCRITLPANEEIRARGSRELVFCQSCGRILYAAI